MAARSESVRFDIIGNDRASEAFSRAGRAAAAMGGEMGDAAAKAAFLDDALKRQRETVRRSAEATLVLARTDRILADAEGDLARKATEADLALRRRSSGLRGMLGLLGRGAGGAGGGLLSGLGALGSAGSSGLGAVPLAGGNPYAGAGIAAGALASAPFLGQIAGGGLIAALGGGLAALGIAGALITQKFTGAKVSVQQLTAAQDRLNASQDRLNALQKSGKATSAQLASAQASVASAQDSLNKLQAKDTAAKNFAAEYAQQLKVQAAFSTLKDHATDSLATIGRSFTPVLLAIAQTANDVLGTLTPVFATAVKSISGPFREFADVLIRTLARPDVKNSIQDVAKAFGAILTAVTPALGSTIGNVAIGISKIAKAISANPQVFASFVQFLGMVAGGALTAIAWLTKVASYIEAHFAPAMHRVAVIFDGVRHDIAHTWDQIWNNSVGMVIRIGHNVETQWNSWTHGIAVIFDGFRHDIAHYWDMLWNNTVGREIRGMQDVVSWFKGLPGRIMGALTGLGANLWGYGKRIINDFLTGMKSVAGGVLNWVKNLASAIWGSVKSFFHIGSPSGLMYDAGKNIVLGLANGIRDHAHLAMSQIGALTGGAASRAAGAVGTEQRYAASLLGSYGWGQNQMGALISLWNRESGWNPNAVNPSSGAYGIPQALPGAWGHPYNLGDWMAQIRWGLAYISGRYGSPGAAWAHEVSAGWYDQGGWLPPGLSLALNTTGKPERVGGGNTYVTVNVGPGTVNGREVGRQIAAALAEFKRGGGFIYKPGGF